MRNILAMAAIAVATVLTTSGVVAFSDPANASVVADNPPHIVVRVEDLNLKSAAGRATAEYRIRDAATRVCAFGSASPIESNRCRSNAIQGAERMLAAQTAAL